MKSMKKWFILLSIMCTTLASASPSEWQIDPKASSLKFSATQNDSPLVGEFKQFTGEIMVDPEHYKASTIHIIVDMDSLSASYGQLVTTLATPDWFNIKAFPKAEFKATEFNKTGDKTYQANGTLTIRNKSAPIIITFTAEETSKDNALVEGSTTIKRTAFGVGQGEWASTSEIKDDVIVNFKIVATKKK